MSQEKPPLPSGDVRIPVGPNLTAVYNNRQLISQSPKFQQNTVNSLNPSDLTRNTVLRVTSKPKSSYWGECFGFFCARLIVRIFLVIFVLTILRAACKYSHSQFESLLKGFVV